MSDQERNRDHAAGELPPRPAGGADPRRRRLAAGGLAGAGVLMTLSSRSALGQTVGGCGSESASAAMSRNDAQIECGCSPGFWWNPNGLRVWDEYLPAQYAQGASFNTVFCSSLPLAVKPFFKNDATALVRARKKGSSYPTTNYDDCGFVDAVGMHAVAALLNAEFYGTRYPAGFTSGAEVVAAFQTALAGGCTGLEVFKSQVDVYEGLWCFNGSNWGE